LAVTTGRRVETLPEVKTMIEAGVPGYDTNSWQCMVAPAHVPAPIIATLNTALVDLLAAPESRNHFLALGVQPISSTPDELGATIRSEIARWTGVLKGIGASVE
jgi:tripartite-type tricarboxylate transporter receptor subunit TctC